MDIVGNLVYSDDGRYEIHESNGRILYLSNILDETYYSTKVVSLRIMQPNKLYFNEKGILYRRKNDYGYYSYFINGEDLESALFDNVGDLVCITLISGVVEDYGQFIEQRAV